MHDVLTSRMVSLKNDLPETSMDDVRDAHATGKYVLMWEWTYHRRKLVRL